jgi:two-component system, response regulator PdtaR
MKHALIIEDRALIAMMIEQQLVEFGYRSAHVAASEEEAIRAAEQRCPDLITADDRLASGSGIAAVRHICREQAIPVVFITGDPEQIKRSVPDAVVVGKPFTFADLRLAIPAALKAARVYS